MQDPQNNTEKKDKSGVRTAGAISFVFLLTLFAKGDRANLSKAERNELADLTALLVKAWKGKRL